MALPLGILISGLLYVNTLVSDREKGLRYLLNFAGMRSSAYLAGILAGEFVIYSLPQILLYFFFQFFGYKAIQPHAFLLFVEALAFGPAFLALCQLLGFMFEKEETASQYIVILLGLVYGLPNFKREILKWLSPITMLGDAFTVTLQAESEEPLWPFFLAAFV